MNEEFDELFLFLCVKLHCLCVLLNCEKVDDLHVHIKDIYSLISVLVTGFQLPTWENGLNVVILLWFFSFWFVLPFLSLLHRGAVRRFVEKSFLCFTKYLFFRVHRMRVMEVICWFPFVQILYLLGDVLLKTRNDEVRLNCIGSLSIFNFNIFIRWKKCL